MQSDKAFIKRLFYPRWNSALNRKLNRKKSELMGVVTWRAERLHGGQALTSEITSTEMFVASFENREDLFNIIGLFCQ